MITLRNFSERDIDILQTHYGKNRTLEETREMISEWAKKQYNNRYYEMFAVVNEQVVVGAISLYHHSQNVISCGPEIFECYRGKGFGKMAMIVALEKAKEKGYKIVLQQIRTDNVASIRLHESLGFETDGYVYRNRREREVLIYLKLLDKGWGR